MRLMRTAGVLCVLLMIPATAGATWWDWIQEMSGPGPFQAHTVSTMATVCPKEWSNPVGMRPVNSDAARPDKACWFIDVRTLSYDPNDGNFPAAVSVLVQTFGLAWPFLKHQTADFGMGLGYMHFIGADNATATRFIFEPRVTVEPVAAVAALICGSAPTCPVATSPYARFFKFHAEYLLMPQSLSAQQLGVPLGTGTGQSIWSKQGEAIGSWGFIIDLAELIRPRQ
jgi:hypothetical protein